MPFETDRDDLGQSMLLRNGEDSQVNTSTVPTTACEKLGLPVTITQIRPISNTANRSKEIPATITKVVAKKPACQTEPSVSSTVTPPLIVTPSSSSNPLTVPIEKNASSVEITTETKDPLQIENEKMDVPADPVESNPPKEVIRLTVRKLSELQTPNYGESAVKNIASNGTLPSATTNPEINIRPFDHSYSKATMHTTTDQSTTPKIVNVFSAVDVSSLVRNMSKKTFAPVDSQFSAKTNAEVNSMMKTYLPQKISAKRRYTTAFATDTNRSNATLLNDLLPTGQKKVVTLVVRENQFQVDNVAGKGAKNGQGATKESSKDNATSTVPFRFSIDRTKKSITCYKQLDFRCNICLKFNETFQEFTNHMRVTHDLEYSCKTCHSSFGSRTEYENHAPNQQCTNAANRDRMYLSILDPPVILKKNNDVLGFKCKHCQKMFLNQRNYCEHGQQHARYFRCKICMSTPMTASAMSTHLSTHYTASRQLLPTEII